MYMYYRSVLESIASDDELNGLCGANAIILKK